MPSVPNTIPNIDICIATYYREDQLAKLITRLHELETGGLFSFSVIIADNSPEATARSVVENGFSSSSGINHQYIHQPVKNIATTRNVAAKASDSDYIAFIDDDEIPKKDWLLNLYKASVSHNADVVNGPIVPDFAVPAPAWIQASEYFNADPRKTGTTGYYSAATNNCLIKAELIRSLEKPFSEHYGISGGEDSEFFYRLRQQGKVFCWCGEAQVIESIPANRLTADWLVRRFFRQGNTFVRVRLEHGSSKTYFFYLFKAILKMLLLTPLILITLLVYPIKKRPFFAALHRLIMTAGEFWSLTGNYFKEYSTPPQ